MINVQEVVTDADFTTPSEFSILRKSGVFTSAGFSPSSTTIIVQNGPVQQASNKEIEMLPEADRIGSIRAFWTTIPIYVTSATRQVAQTFYLDPTGAIPGTQYTVVSTLGVLYKNRKALRLNIDYTQAGDVITLAQPTVAGDTLVYVYTEQTEAGTGVSDVIQYLGHQYRILSVFRIEGSGYWKALGTRMEAA